MNQDESLSGRADTLAGKESLPTYQSFWPGIITALGAESRDVDALRGASGMTHNVLALGVDEPGRRLIVVSPAGDAASAALARADIQTAFDSVRVLLARPVLVDLSAMARQLQTAMGRTSISSTDLKAIAAAAAAEDADEATRKQALQPYFDPLVSLMAQWSDNASGVGQMGFITALLQVIDQIRHVELVSSADDFGIDFSRLLMMSSTATDEEYGICGLPLHAFSGDEMELVNSGVERNDISEVLRRYGIYQYFFPAADQLALGLADRLAPKVSDLVDGLKAAPALGHPFGTNEIVPSTSNLTDMIDRLRERGLLVKGEFNVTVSPEGDSVRAAVRFGPRESLVSKVINRITVKMDIRSFFHIG